MKRSNLSVDTWVGAAPKPRLGNLELRFSKATQWRWLTMSLLLTDFALIGLSFRLAYWIRFELNLPIFKLDVVPDLDFYQTFSLASIPIWILIFAIFSLYSRDNLLGGTKEYDLIFRATTFMMFVVVMAGYLEVFVLSRGWLIIVWLTTLGLLISGRFALRRLVYWLRGHGFFLTPALIIGANEEGALLGEQLHRWHRSGLYLIGYVDGTVDPGTPVNSEHYVLGGLDMLEDLIRRYRVGELVLATSALNRETMIDIFRNHGLSDNVNLRMSSGLFEIITTGLQIKELAYVPLVGIDKVRLTGLNEFIKLLLDIGLAIPMFILLAPVILVLSILIKLDSPGPVLHRRRVMGLNGGQFDAFKFRTMSVEGDEILAKHPELLEELERTHKLKDDPRVTKVGRFLRKYSLDELPQLFNVLRREMSLVGPRMISPPEMKEYNKWGINLLTVRPGITGLWQVSGRSDLSYERRVRLDMYYIRNWSIWLDLYLIAQTLPAVLRGTGAY